MLTRKINLGAAAIDARSTFDPETRARYMNGSEAMSCIRKQWYAKHQPEHGEEQDWGYARRGKNAERYVVECLHAANVPMMLTGEDQESLTDEDTMISATPDGVLLVDDMMIAVEFKSIDPRANKKNLPKAPHVTQLHIGMALMEKHADRLGLPKTKFDYGIVMYIDASNYSDILECRIERNPKIVASLARRARQILGARNVARLPREGKANGGNECRSMCSFKTICGVTSAPTVAKTKTGRGNKGTVLNVAVQSYADGKAAEAVGKAAKDQAAEEIKTELHARSVNEISVDGYDIKLAPVAGRKSLDRKAVTKAGIDLSPFEWVGVSSERLTVT